MSEIKYTGRSLVKKIRTAESDYIDKEYGWMIGKTIADIRPMTQREVSKFYWLAGDGVPFVVWFTDNSCFIPMSDEEGNAPGVLLCQDVKA